MRDDLELTDVLLKALENQYSTDPSSLRQFVRRARRLTYSSTIISCYGIIEQTVDSMLVSIAEAYNEFLPAHEDLPETVRSTHRDLLLQCLRDGERSRTRARLDEKDILAAMGTAPDKPPALLPAAFTLSTANYRFPYVRSLFSRLGLDIEKRGLYRGRVDEALRKADFANYESFVTDLVQRRNDLAHSFGDQGIIDRDLLGTYVEIVEGAMLDLLRLTNLAAMEVLRDWTLEPIGKVVKEWSGRIGLDVEVGTISVGDQIALYKGEWCTSHKVEELQTHNVTTDSLSYDDAVLQVGVKIAGVPPGVVGCEVFVLPRELAEYWPSAEKWG